MQKNRIKNIGLWMMIFIASLLALNVGIASASELFFNAEKQEFVSGDEFVVDVFLNTEDDLINAVEGEIFFPQNLIKAKEIRDGNSTVNFWVDRPSIETDGIITFSGITPGGYKGNKKFLFSVVFEAIESGDGSIGIRDEKALLHDGKGTPAIVRISPFEFVISKREKQVELSNKTVKPITVEPMEDTDPPESFTPIISRDEEVFEGKYFLVFDAQDKGSGIDRYEISEGLLDKFKIAESPYLLQNQDLDGKISVKAIDKNGNIRVENIYPEKWHPWYEKYWIVILLVISGLLLIYILRKKRGETKY